MQSVASSWRAAEPQATQRCCFVQPSPTRRHLLISQPDRTQKKVQCTLSCFFRLLLLHAPSLIFRFRLTANTNRSWVPSTGPLGESFTDLILPEERVQQRRTERETRQGRGKETLVRVEELEAGSAAELSVWHHLQALKGNDHPRILIIRLRTIVPRGVRRKKR